MELFQFRYSPYNEKVRWALDFKRVPHQRRSLLPGPHMATVRPLTGRSLTPVLRDGHMVLDESSRILEWLEQQHPSPALFPSNAADRAEALRLQTWFDSGITPRLRRSVLHALLDSPRYFARVFADGHGALTRGAYALAVPLAGPIIRKGNGITGDASVADGWGAALEALDFVAERAARGPYLVGTQFSLADLVVASTLAVAIDPPGSPMARPTPHGAAFAAFLARFASHPGAGWVRSMYAQHRASAGDFEGRSNY